MTTRIRVQGMDCASCAIKIENALQRMPGVTGVNVSVAGGTVTVKHDRPDTDGLRSQISGPGYKVTGAEDVGAKANPDGHSGDASGAHEEDAHSHSRDHGIADQSLWRTRKCVLTIASGSALAAAFLAGKTFPATERWAFLLAMLVGLTPIGRRAISAALTVTPFSI